MSASYDESSIDRIYETALIPERWPDVLQEISDLAGSFGAAIFLLNGQSVPRWVTSKPLEPVMLDWIAGNWQARTLRTSRMLSTTHAGFVRDLDVFTPDEIEAEPSITQFFRPRGLGWGTGTFVPLSEGANAVVSIERRFEAGPVTDGEVAILDSLRPHLARVALLSSRLGLERARTAAATLDLVGLAAALLGDGGRVICTNALFDALGQQFTLRAGGKITFRAARANAVFARAILSRERSCVRSIAVPSFGGAPAAIAHVIPIRGDARDIFTGVLNILLVSPVGSKIVADASIVQGLYDLSPAEAHVAQMIANGSSVESIALFRGISKETVRAQLKSIFIKTGTNRQAELVGLLAGCSSKI